MQSKCSDDDEHNQSACNDNEVILKRLAESGKQKILLPSMLSEVRTHLSDRDVSSSLSKWKQQKC